MKHTLMKPKILFVIAALLFCIGLLRAPALIPVSIDGCQNITSSGSYSLGSDLVGANITANNLLTTACILISEPNVEFDCYGRSITNDVAGNTTGILLDSRNSTSLTNVTIKNCVVSNYVWDVYIYNSSSSLVLNNTANLAVNIGFTAHNSSSVNFTNNTARNNPGDGFSLINSFYNIVDNNTAYNSSYGFVSKDDSAYNNFTNDNASNVSVGFYTYYSYNNTFTSNNAGNNTWGFIASTSSTGNNFTNCTAYGSYWHGFLAQGGASDNNFVNDISYGNSYEGFYIAGSSYNNLINNIAYNNNEDGFLVGNGSAYTVLTNNTAYDNRYSGFEIDNSNNNNLTGNLYNQSPYNSGLLRYGDGFYFQNSSNNNVVNNTAVNSYEAGFYLYDNSNSSSFINNTAINNSWEGFIIETSFNNSFTNNFAYANPQFGFEIYLSYGNNLTNNTVQESGVFDFYIDALSWGFFLNTTQGDPIFCNNIIENLTGSGGRPINYSNTSVNWNGITASEIVLCHADGSNLTNVTIRGSDSIQNNGLLMSSTSNTVVDGSNSSRNIVGFAALSSTNNNFTNNIANENLFAGFADIIGAGNRFADNLESGSIEGGFFVFFSNNSVYTNNTAHDNYMAGFAIVEGSNNTRLTNNTAYNNSQVGTMVDSADFTTITGDHYYSNDVDFAVNTTLELAPLNLSGVIFDNPLGNYEYYTNISLNDVVQPDESYAISWSTKPTDDPPFELSFYGKFINILAPPGTAIDNIIWHWSDAEAASRNEGTLRIYLYKGSGWQNPPGQSILNTVNNQLSISNLNEFGVFGLYEMEQFSPSSGGGGGCSSSLKTSVETTICPDNKVVILLKDTLSKPMGGGQLVTLTSQGQTFIEHTNSSGEVSFILSHSGSYTIGGVACDYSFNYEMCRTGCTSDDDCADSQYCASGECKPVGCPCGQISIHSCHPYACCADSDCTANYKCVNHECKASVAPECSSNSDCKDDQYCSNGKCIVVQLGACGYITNHAWHNYECCNDSECQKGSACINNSCVTYRIVTNPSGFVGAQHEAWVLPAGEYRLSITTPKGESKTVGTDATGHAIFVLETAGIYSVSLAKEQASVNVSVNAVIKQNQTSTPAGTPAAPPDLCLPGAIIGIILLLIIIYIIYRRR